MKLNKFYLLISYQQKQMFLSKKNQFMSVVGFIPDKMRKQSTTLSAAH